ncbi:hypothetical protein EUX98_g4022 [Antrodiella citrinella]|uniref:Uncharacterized protein n=1 Tax=Antrodiella citrinella TaxID=2447956 RepID=A0A4S4MV61_9APHY|nr:hypothetical protein EUX98_g4022 [Antrodiella citrinella]
MAPKPRNPTRKPSVSSKDGPPKSQIQNSMPPPPVPPQPQGILVPEVMALSTCLRNAVVKTGQIYGHYADTRKLAIHKYAPYPPRSLTTSLGREVEKYDQLCDAIESHLLHAINVLQRDLSRAQDKLNAAAAVPMAISPSPVQAPLPPTGPPLQSASSEDASMSSEAKVVSSLRRPSTISLSSLHRPPFPHKLDLSSTALRINPDDPLSLQSGLASPVTLAPKSSISRLPPDLMSGQHVEIDLTMEDDDMGMSNQLNGGAGLGSSADQPIELDLDLEMDLFGDGSHQKANASGQIPLISPVIVPKREDAAMDLSLLTDVNAIASGSMHENALLGFNTQPSGEQQRLPATLAALQQGQSVPSPGSLFSGLQQSGSSETNFDFGLHFLEPDMRLDDLAMFDMNGGSTSVQPQGGESSSTVNTGTGN